MNIRHDDVVHGIWAEADGSQPLPICGDSIIPATLPELTNDVVDCCWCKSILE